MEERKTRLIHDLQDHIRYLSELGAEFIAAPDTSPGPAASSGPDLGALEALIRRCEKCPLSQTRTQAVPGEGSAQADLMFIGEGPGHDEDAQGLPFVGRAGQLLTKIINAMGFRREDVYITNLVKCRPPQNRNPNGEEIEACTPYLQQQLDLIRPRVIVSLGNVPTHFLLETRSGITVMRGTFQKHAGIPVMPTFHPSYLVRNEQNRELKRMVWEDMKQVMELLGRK
ncbi:MAG: uracil-DNA glycosylase [Candidatus Aminicenantaceae bacterium]